MQISTAGKPRNNPSGFTYVMVLVAVVILGIVLETANVQISFVQRREREKELLYRGQAYQTAIRYFYKAHNNFPRSLKDLLKDPHAINKHYLRALYTDPVSRGKTPWKLIRATDGGISGVASQSEETPLKKANFPQGLENFEKAKTYAEWEFVYKPKVTTPASVPLTTVKTTVPAAKNIMQSPAVQQK